MKKYQQARKHFSTNVLQWICYVDQAFTLLRPKVLAQLFSEKCNELELSVSEDFLNFLDVETILEIARRIYEKRG